AAMSLYGTWLIPPMAGQQPWEYLGWPPTLTVNRVRPWKLLLQAMISCLSGPTLSFAQRRASLKAASLASAPALTNSTRSAKVAATSLAARRNAGSLVMMLDT